MQHAWTVRVYILPKTQVVASKGGDQFPLLDHCFYPPLFALSAAMLLQTCQTFNKLTHWTVLSRDVEEILLTPCHSHQATCICLGDSVTFRYHWPLHTELRVNGTLYRCTARSAPTKLGANQRDEPADIGSMVTPGVGLSCCVFSKFQTFNEFFSGCWLTTDPRPTERELAVSFATSLLLPKLMG